MRYLIGSSQSHVRAIKLHIFLSSSCFHHIPPLRKPHEFSLHAYKNHEDDDVNI